MVVHSLNFYLACIFVCGLEVVTLFCDKSQLIIMVSAVECPFQFGILCYTSFLHFPSSKKINKYELLVTFNNIMNKR